MNSYFNPKDHRIKTVFFMWASYKLSKYCSKDYKKKSYNKWSKKLSKISCPKNIHKIHPPVDLHLFFEVWISILTNSVFCLFRTWILQTIQVVKIKFGVHWNSFLKIHLKKIRCRSTRGTYGNTAYVTIPPKCDILISGPGH